jgi:hypothetical protein
VVHRQAGLGLPLVHHLVQHGVLDFRPVVTRQMAPAERDLDRPPALQVHGQFTEPDPHTAGDPDRNVAKRTTEVAAIQLLVEPAKTVQQPEIAGPGAIRLDRAVRRRRELLDRERQKLPLGGAPRGLRQTGIEKTDDRGQDIVGGERIPAVEPEHVPGPDAHHDGAIGVGDDAGEVAEAQGAEADRYLVHNSLCRSIRLPARQPHNP